MPSRPFARSSAEFTRRSALLAGFSLAGGTLLAACGSGSDERVPGDSPASTAPGNFPATVQHRFGETTVEAEPKRIVVVGLSEQDIVLELGFTPVAVTEWYGEQPYAVWPWAQKLLGDAEPTVLSTADGFEYEKIASLQPDLIIGTNSGMKESDYEKFSKMAPTLPGVVGGTDYFSPWEDQTLLIAKALGQEKVGQNLVESTKDAYAQAAEANPEFAGKVATFSQNGFYDGLIYVYPPGLGTDFLSMLGFTVNPDLTELAKPGEQAAISSERLDVIDTDVLVIAAEKAEDIATLEKVPTYAALGVVKEQRTVYTDPILSGAMYFVTPASLKYVLEHLTPALKKAVAGESPAEITGAA
ncbi:putative ABC transporter, periplasmic substrate-binding protein [Kineosporia sp. NBRC 101677]|uniref:ABC transporter substrate-binding protein n=1 Tax=Kineosporia sp. NBRC 101677 TaxID=3032197 RepID=UPI00249FD9BC|nr:ABC transporter substrate-binding protein [Kineosporia sp. NBRC 101677]GLY14492.1 putative ABC transporter, periplasmic substrate-binding protein [Kineosporia sp. NBRC 101677]